MLLGAGLARGYVGREQLTTQRFVQLPDTPIYGLQGQGITGMAPASIEERVDNYMFLLRATQPYRPYLLLGWSSGGGIPHALAIKLQAAGEEVSLLVMMDAYPSDIWQGKAVPQQRYALLTLLDVIGAAAQDADGQPLSEPAMLVRCR